MVYTRSTNGAHTVESGFQAHIDFKHIFDFKHILHYCSVTSILSTFLIKRTPYIYNEC